MKRREIPEWMLTRSIFDYFEYFTGRYNWGLEPEEQLKLLNLDSEEKLSKLKHSKEKLSDEIIVRIDYLAKIFEYLQALLLNRAAVSLWIREPNTNVLFGGKSPLEKMSSSKLEDLKMICDYLNNQMGQKLERELIEWGDEELERIMKEKRESEENKDK